MINDLDKFLHQQFTRLGRDRNQLTYKLLAILPEIFQRGIYKKYGYQTIYEYAGKLAGLSRITIDKALRLEQKLENKPCLQKTISECGVHKVSLIAKLATPETDAAWADKVKNMSIASLQELSKEVRKIEKIKMEPRLFDRLDSAPGPEIRPTMGSTMGLEISTMSIVLDNESQFLFLKLKKEFFKKQHVHMSNKEALKQMLQYLAQHVSCGSQKAFLKTSQQSSELAPPKIIDDFSKRKIKKSLNPKKLDKSSIKTKCLGKITRYIPIQIRRTALQETDERCAYPGCNNPYENFHHRIPFSLSRNHDSIVPLCKKHHEFMHNGLIKNELMDPSQWILALDYQKHQFLEKTLKKPDLLFRKYHNRQSALSSVSSGIP